MYDENLLRYQDYVAFLRRFDRDLLLVGFSQLGRGWDGNPFDASGRPKQNLPWNIAGAASVVLARGSGGGQTPTLTDCSRIVYDYARIEPPRAEDGTVNASGLLAHWVYQQWPFNRVNRDQWARSVALFSTEFPRGYRPEALTPGWEMELFGTSLRDFIAVALLLWATTNQGSAYPYTWTPEMEHIRDALGGQEAIDRITIANFATDFEGFKEARKRAVQATAATAGQQYLREPFAFNPLFATPLVAGVLRDAWLAPCAPAVNLRVSTVGIVYAGVVKWGEKFHHDLGVLFEQYVGTQLRQIESASISPEVKYGPKKSRKSTIDWFVIAPDFVVLVECKSAIPNQAIREGLVEQSAAYARALRKGIYQLNSTWRLANEGVPELDFIPTDRPIIGLVATLGDFDLADEDFARSELPDPEFPICLVSVEFIDSFVTMDYDDMRNMMAEVPDFTDSRGFIQNMAWRKGRPGRANVILDESYSSIPTIGFARALGIDTH